MADINLTIDRQTQPLPLGNFSTGLIMAQSTESSAPVQEYKEYESLDSVKNDYSESGSPRVVNWAEHYFESGGGTLAIYNMDRATPSNTDISSALDTIVSEGHEFFGVAMTSREGTASSGSQGTSGDRLDLIDWAETNDKKAFITNNVGETISTAETWLNNNGNEHAYFLYFTNSSQSLTSVDHPLDAAMMGRVMANFPGSINYKYQQLWTGIPTSDVQPADITTLENAGGAVYTTKKGLKQTSAGISADPQVFADVVDAELWLRDNIRSRIYDLLVTVDKIPMTNAGASQVANELEQANEEGIEEDVIAEVVRFDIPNLDNFTPAERATRDMGPFEEEIRLAGAANTITINVTLTS